MPTGALSVIRILNFTYGLNVNLTYKGFDLGAFFYGVAGKDVVNYTSWWTDYFSSFQGAKSKAALNDAWTTTNQNARLPIVENSSNFSNQAVFNSSLDRERFLPEVENTDPRLYIQQEITGSFRYRQAEGICAGGQPLHGNQIPRPRS
jgi:hypothetical protein